MTVDALSYLVEKYNIDLTQPSPFTLQFNRQTDLPALFRELGFTSGAEIGVLYGDFSATLCRELPDATIYSVDAWQYYPVWNDFRRPHHYQAIYRRAVAQLEQYPNSRIIRQWSQDAVKDFADESLDFVFIDADHRFRSMVDDIAEWSKKVRLGGIVSGHDFAPGRHSQEFVHAIYVVPAWCAAYRIHPWFVLDAPNERSWMWVKQ